jgi:hypothetical protein
VFRGQGGELFPVSLDAIVAFGTHIFIPNFVQPSAHACCNSFNRCET